MTALPKAPPLKGRVAGDVCGADCALTALWRGR